MGITERPIYHTPYGDVMTWVTGEDATSGAYSLHERTAPPGARSTPHVHHHLSESFYVLSGSFEFSVGEATTHGGAGAFVLAPSGTTHSWRVLSDEPARALVIFAPSAKHAYFEEMDALVRTSAGAADPAKLLALAERFGWT